MTRALACLLPGGALLMVATMLPSITTLQDSLTAYLPVYFYVVFGGGILLAWRFDRGRLVLALLILALADRALLYLGPVGFSAVALLLPLDLGVLSWLSERGVLTPRGRVKLMLLLLQLLAVVIISYPALGSVTAWLNHPIFESPVLQAVGRAVGLPEPALLVFALAFLLVTVRFMLHPTTLESGSIWALIAAFLAVATDLGGLRSTIYLTTAGLILVVSLLETSHSMAYGDDLTGLPGRRALNEALVKLGNHYAIAMVDLDHFKRFNDAHGHDVGDQLLRLVGSRLARVGGGGKVFRYGGEEFAVLFPGKSVQDAAPHLEIVRETIAASTFTVRGRGRPRAKPQAPRASAGQTKVFATISIGLAQAARRHSTPAQVIKAADAALYRAKGAGRNRLST